MNDLAEQHLKGAEMVSDQSRGFCGCLREELIAAPRVHV